MKKKSIYTTVDDNELDVNLNQIIKMLILLCHTCL